MLNVLSHKPDVSFANNAIRMKPNFMLSAFNKWSFDSEQPQSLSGKFVKPSDEFDSSEM